MDARYTEGIVKCINSRALVPCKGKIGRKCLKDRLPVELRKQTNEVLLALNSLDDDAFVKQIAALLGKEHDLSLPDSNMQHLLRLLVLSAQERLVFLGQPDASQTSHTTC